MRDKSGIQNNVDLEEADIVSPDAVRSTQQNFFLDNNFNTTKTQESFNEHKGIYKISLDEIDGNAIRNQVEGYQEAVKILNDANDNEILDIHINKIEEAPPQSPPKNLNTHTHSQDSQRSQPSISQKG